ncbi:hypothetical protein [Gaetbulibacter aestuarii]|uniref:Uncharacterized protein n=1 Tax=Gaetbulibacter aestuarii TaxID=1502358 RepID=A0ABW7MXD8_9FLAO
MKTTLLTLITSFIIGFNALAQTSLNDYKYVIVPKKYEFLKEPNQYQINALSKFLFKKYGFDAYMEGEQLPEDLQKNRCLALNSDLVEDSGLFKTKLNLVLKNCDGVEVYKGPEGESREKDFKRAFTEATRNAFKPLELLNYSYQPKTDMVAESKQSQDKPEIKKPEAEMLTEAPKKKQNEVIVVATPQVPTAISNTSSETLYAQEITNGYQLVDRSPKVVYRMFNTQVADVYLVENRSAVIYKTNGQWIYEALENGVVSQKVLNIKF